MLTENSGTIETLVPLFKNHINDQLEEKFQ